MKFFTAGEVAKILDLPNSRIRSFVKAGFLAPSRGRKQALQFTFQDVLFLKTAKGLLDSRVPSKNIVRILSSLKRQLPDDRHLASVKIYADGRRVIVWDGGARWQPDSGQFLFNFEAGAVVQSLRAAPAPAADNGRELSARDWFNVALELEATSSAEAQRAYHQALQLDSKMADAHLNLGRLYHEGGDFKKAEAHYRAAAACAPEDPAPRFNLGVLLDDTRRIEPAGRAYREALELDPNFADAHYNLALLCDALGKKVEALAHLRAARKLYLNR